jgi:hypothetical protein
MKLIEQTSAGFYPSWCDLAQQNCLEPDSFKDKAPAKRERPCFI